MKPDQHVASQGQFALERGGPVGHDIALFDLLAELDDRLLVLAGPLVEARRTCGGDERCRSPISIRVGCRRSSTVPFLPSANRSCPSCEATSRSIPVATTGGSAHQERHRLPLHVGTHRRAVGVVVLEERDQTGRDADHLLGAHVHVLHLVERHHVEVGADSGR